jgi:hypothetical protein
VIKKRAGTFLLNHVALFSHDLSSKVLVGALELLHLSANLLLLQRNTAESQLRKRTAPSAAWMHCAAHSAHQ